MSMRRSFASTVFARWPGRARHVDLATGGRGDGPPDLDELWRDFNRKLSKIGRAHV